MYPLELLLPPLTAPRATARFYNGVSLLQNGKAVASCVIMSQYMLAKIIVGKDYRPEERIVVRSNVLPGRELGRIYFGVF